MKLPELPYKTEFLLNIVNNNMSEQTVKNYKRDLLIFQLFLYKMKRSWDNVDKLLVLEYKGFLKNGQHHEMIDLYEKSKFEEESDEDLEDEAGKASQERRMKGSRSKGSRRRPNAKSGLSARSINRMLSSIRSYVTFLVDMNINSPLPASSIKMLKTTKRESQVAEFAELKKLIEFPEEHESKRDIRYRNRAILELLFSTGMRISELVNLDREQVSLSGDADNIESKIYVLGKGKKQRFVYLTDRCTSYLRRYLETRKDDFPALFIPYRGGRRTSADEDEVRISQNYVQAMMKKYRKLLGIVIPTTPHSLRHGFATYLAEQGANPAAIQHLLGHESLQTTTRYVHSSDKFAEKTHRKYHPLKKS
ncbi:tyrosine-type recombinase/integrase [Candidatus Dojkabacteria bacterium]|nr:tyrosine-type recombinase/integrase [Candidatus Dojkabacteria bacterium]